MLLGKGESDLLVQFRTADPKLGIRLGFDDDSVVLTNLGKDVQWVTGTGEGGEQFTDEREHSWSSWSGWLGDIAHPSALRASCNCRWETWADLFKHPGVGLGIWVSAYTALHLYLVDKNYTKISQPYNYT